MSTQFIFNTILIIISLEFFIERILDYLNMSKLSVDVPQSLQYLYSSSEYKKSQEYLQHKNKLSLISSVISFVVIFISIYFNIFSYIDSFVRLFTDNTILMSLYFFGIIMFFSGFVNLPFSYYSVFVTEQKYGFNTTTKLGFFADIFKNAFLSIIIGGLLFSLIIFIYMSFGDKFWYLSTIIVSGVSVFMNMFYSSLIVPLFNKQTPLCDGSLKHAISKLALDLDFKIDNIYIIDGSKRSTKANAYFSGIGASKRIVLYDTLIEQLSQEQILAVLSHEIGHYKHKHSLISLCISVFSTALMFYMLSVCLSLPNISYALGVSLPSFHIGLLCFVILYSPFSTFISLFMNAMSRKHEYQADAYACKHYNATHLGDGLIKLSINSLSNLRPHPLYEFFYYSHPSLLRRLDAISYKK